MEIEEEDIFKDSSESEEESEKNKNKKEDNIILDNFGGMNDGGDTLLSQLSNTKNNSEIEEKEIVFRNYYPINENFKVEKNNYFELIKETEQKVEKKILNEVKNFLNLEKNPLNMIPTKNNIDLKRNISDKLDLLNKQTEIAVSEIIKERVEKKKQKDNE